MRSPAMSTRGDSNSSTHRLLLNASLDHGACLGDLSDGTADKNESVSLIEG
jgi:hypothetical protein